MHALEPVPAETSIVRNLAGADGASDGLGTVQHPARVAAELNRRFRAGENDGRYLTMVLCVLDTLSGRVHVASAGHPPPALLRGGVIVPLPDVGGFPIAMLDDAEYEDAALQLEPGDRLCLFSDGLLEQPDPAAEEQFGRERLIRGLCSRGEAPADRAVSEVIDDLAGWAGSRSFEDDVSLVIIEWVCGHPV
jgi:sigma-B regulation protein RsbU (phosphoserine phosphatase)